MLGGKTEADSVYRSINEEVRKLSKRREQGWVAGVLRASMDEDDLSRCIRRIQSLLRRLEVSNSVLPPAVTESDRCQG